MLFVRKLQKLKNLISKRRTLGDTAIRLTFRTTRLTVQIHHEIIASLINGRPTPQKRKNWDFKLAVNGKL